MGLRFKERLLKELGSRAEPYTGPPEDTEMKAFELRRNIGHHSVVTQQFQQKFVPEELQMPSDDDVLTIGTEENLFKMFFIIRRWLLLPTDMSVIDKD